MSGKSGTPSHPETGGPRVRAADFGRRDSFPRQLFETMVENAADMVLVTEAEPIDLPGPRIVYANRSFCERTRYELDELVGQTPRMFQGPESDRTTLDRIRRALGQWESIRVELLNYNKDGTTFWSELHIMPIANEFGWYTHWLSVHRDVTERRQQHAELDRRNRELELAKEEAERANQAKSAFLATMSHEIRTPLNGILGIASLLLDEGLDPEHQDLVRTIRTSGSALLGIINDVLDFSKVEAGHLELESRPFPLLECIEEVLEMVAPAAAEKGLDLGYLPEGGVPEWVVGDSARLRQVLLNLVGNAVKFTHAGEVAVFVSALADSDGLTGIQLAVCDTGIGIPARHQDRLFRPFSQVDASITRRFGGSGLGLAISRRLVRLMNGSLTVESVEGEGSTFSVQIPLPVGEGGSVPSPLGQELRGRSVGLRTRWPVARAFLKGLLEKQGARVIDGSATSPVDVALVERGFNFPGSAHRRFELVFGRYRPRNSSPNTLDLRSPLRERNVLERLAVALGSPGREPPSRSSRPGPRLERPVGILVVEDNPVNRKVALRMLQRLGMEADVAENGSEAVRRVLEKGYDIVLMDLQMPVMDGLTATRAIREQASAASQPRIVALTANALGEDARRCEEAGMDDYLTKPIELDTLRDAIERNAAAAPPAKLGPR